MISFEPVLLFLVAIALLNAAVRLVGQVAGLLSQHIGSDEGYSPDAALVQELASPAASGSHHMLLWQPRPSGTPAYPLGNRKDHASVKTFDALGFMFTLASMAASVFLLDLALVLAFALSPHLSTRVAGTPEPMAMQENVDKVYRALVTGGMSCIAISRALRASGSDGKEY